MTLGFLSGSRNFFKTSLGFLWSFVFFFFCTNTPESFERLSPAPLLHIGDCSKFAIVTEDLVICFYQVTKIWSSRYGFAIASSAWCLCNFGPSTDLAISVIREMSINTVLTKSSRLLVVGSKDTLWEELAWESICNGISSTKFSWILAATPSSQNPTSCPVLSGFHFYLFLCFVGLDFIRLPWSIINQIRHWHWRSVTVSRIFTFSIHNFACCRWKRWRRMTVLFQRCPESRWRSRRRTW